MVEKIQRPVERYALRPERRDGDGGDQQDSGNHGQGAFGDHMNSFSFLRSEYSPATCSP